MSDKYLKEDQYIVTVMKHKYGYSATITKHNVTLLPS